MRIVLTLETDSHQDIDTTHSMGITSEAYDRLADALMDAGFSIVDGPEREDE